MTQTEFTAWLREHYRYGANISHKSFLAAFNAASRLYGSGEITNSNLNNWLHRQPPSEWAGMPLADFLAIVQGIEVMKITKVYRLTLPVDASQLTALEAMAVDSGGSVEDLLRCELLGLVEEMAEERSSA